MRNIAGLIAFVESRTRTGFAWGRSKNDCVSFAIGAVRAQGGRDPLEGSGLRWGSAAGALRALKRRGGLETAVTDQLTPVPPAMALRGDVGLVDGDDGPLLVIVEGDTVVGPGLTGVIRLPRTALLKAWSIEGLLR